MESAEVSEVAPVLNQLQAKAETLELSVTISCLEQEVEINPEIAEEHAAESEAAIEENETQVET